MLYVYRDLNVQQPEDSYLNLRLTVKNTRYWEVSSPLSQRHPCEWAKSMTVEAEVPNSTHPRSASQLVVVELRSPLFRPERMPHEDGQQYHHLHLQLVELTSVLSGE